MAITVTQQLWEQSNDAIVTGDYGKSEQPCIFVVSSDQTAQPNFKYKVEVYEDAPAGTLLAEYLMNANPNGDLIFNATEVIKSNQSRS